MYMVKHLSNSVKFRLYRNIKSLNKIIRVLMKMLMDNFPIVPEKRGGK